MHAGVREALVSLREFFLTFAPFVLLAAGLVYLAYQLLDPTPPKRLTLATGQDQGAYAEFGRRYAKILRENEVEVRLRPSAGAAENLALLRKGEVDVAFVQGGAEPTLDRAANDDEPQDDLVSLGSLFHEPVWIFYRAESAQRLAGTAEITAPPKNHNILDREPQQTRWAVVKRPDCLPPTAYLSRTRAGPPSRGRRRGSWSRCAH